METTLYRELKYKVVQYILITYMLLVRVDARNKIDPYGIIKRWVKFRKGKFS